MPKSDEKELIRGIGVEKNTMGQIIVSSVVRRLAEQGFNVGGTLISYYNPIEEMYIFIGKDPIPPEKDGVGQDCLQKNRLTLRFNLN